MGDRDLGANRLSGLNCDAQVFPHPVNRETKVKFAPDHGLGAVVHLPGLRRPLRNDLHGSRDIEPRALGKVNAF